MPPSSGHRVRRRRFSSLAVLLFGLLLVSAALVAPTTSDARRFRFPGPPTVNPTSGPTQIASTPFPTFPNRRPSPRPTLQPPPTPPPPPTAQPRPQAQLVLTVPALATAGQNVSISAALTQSGAAVPGSSVVFQVNGVFAGNATTGADGNATFSLPGSSIPSPGTYQVRASAGAFFSTASDTATLNVVAAAVTPKSPPPAPVATSMTIQAPSETEVGQDTAVTATLRSRGRPLPGAYVVINVQGSQLKSGLTDAGGRFVYAIPGRKLASQGQYLIQAEYMGAHLLAPSSAQATMNVVPAAIQVQSVPPVSGLVLDLGGISSTTGPDGIATWPIPQNGPYKLSADLNPSKSATVRTSFVGWADGVSTLERTISVSGPAKYYMGLRVAYLDTIGYQDLAGNPVNPSLVGQATIVSQDGTVIVINPQTQSTFWSTAVTAVPVPNSEPPALAASTVKYRVASVKVHGIEALAPGNQPIWTPDEGFASAKLALYELTVRTTDQVTGGPASGNIHLTWSDGTISTLPAQNGTAVFAGLPAAEYEVRRGDGPGPLSGAQTVKVFATETDLLPVLTENDVVMAVIGAVSILCLLLAGLLIVGTRRRNGAMRHAAPGPAAKEGSTAERRVTG